MKKSILFTLAFIFFANILLGQNETKKDSTNNKEKIKTGWNFGVLPAVAFDSDLGFKYGGLINLYNFGDGSTYPNYLQSIYLEISRTTKGSGVNQLFFDSEHLFKNRKLRVTADLSFLTEKALDFYGFNGAEALYNPDFENDLSSNSSYISRMFYRHARKMTRFTCDFQGYIIPDKLRWLGGIAYFGNKIEQVDIDNLNEGKDESEKLPDTASLYDKYIDWGIIPSEEADGGNNQYLKFGLIWDTRDIEANPGHGIWSEALIMTAPSFLGNKENAYTKLVVTHRQYFTLIKKRLTFAYRVGYQGTIAGNAPFYMQAYMISSYSPSVITEGLGGSKSLRGILRNRIVGDDFVFGNFEFRWKFLKTVIKNQNVYLALNPFVDAGKIIDPIDIDKSNIPASVTLSNYFDESKDKFHFTYGCGLHIAHNENFVLSINYGIAADKNDGTKGLYIGTNWLF
ncbi:MAG: hypothetical protein U9R42_05625 [Bacteroidota bacterium]|nr:hypothetical protein [Bacteroidota bacterium]